MVGQAEGGVRQGVEQAGQGVGWLAQEAQQAWGRSDVEGRLQELISQGADLFQNADLLNEAQACAAAEAWHLPLTA